MKENYIIINWDKVSRKKKIISIDNLKEFKDYLNWDIISGEQNLSEDFIREFKDKIKL